MHFKHPEFFWAFFLLLIPIIVHLFQLRKFQKVAFTNVAFLKQIQLQSRKSRTLKKWLTLLARLLALICMIVAFAQPYFPNNNTNFITKRNETVIYLDNSFSMQAQGSRGPLLQEAVQELIENLPQEKQFSLFTNHQVFKNVKLATIQNDLLSLTYSSKRLNEKEAFLKATSLFQDQETTHDYIAISDFQRNQFEDDVVTDSTVNYIKTQLQPENTKNISIDTVQMVETNDKATLKVSLSASSSIENTTISLYNKDELISKSSAEFNDKNKAEIAFTIDNTNAFEGVFKINDQDLQYDNTLFFNINKQDPIAVQIINGSTANNFLHRIYDEKTFVITENTEQAIDFTAIEKQQLIILNEVQHVNSGLVATLQDFVEKGGHLVLIPSEKGLETQYNNLLSKTSIQLLPYTANTVSVTGITFSHPLFTDVFNKEVQNFQYPEVQGYFPIQSENAALTLANNSAFVATSGRYTVLASPLHNEITNFTQSPIVVPLFFNIGKQSYSTPPLYTTIGETNTFSLKVQLQNDEVISIENTSEKFIPQQQVFPNTVLITTIENPENAGIFTIKQKDENIQQLAYNYNRIESKLEYNTVNNTKSAHSITQVFDAMKIAQNPSTVWKWFIIFALLFLGIEMLIQKFVK